MAILFDLDGTLLDSVPAVRDTLAFVLRPRQAPGHAEVARLMGTPLSTILLENGVAEAEVPSIIGAFRAAFTAWGWTRVRPYPGVEAALASLARRHQLAAVTSKGEGEAARLLFDLGLLDHFSAVVGDDGARPLKPDPAPLLDACAQLGVAPDEALMVGDAPTDMQAARAAGCRPVGVAWGPNGSPADAAHIVRKPAGLARL